MEPDATIRINKQQDRTKAFTMLAGGVVVMALVSSRSFRLRAPVTRRTTHGLISPISAANWRPPHSGNCRSDQARTSPGYVISLASAYAVRTNGQEAKVVSWIRTASILAQIDPVAGDIFSATQAVAALRRSPAVGRLSEYAG